MIKRPETPQFKWNQCDVVIISHVNGVVSWTVFFHRHGCFWLSYYLWEILFSLFVQILSLLSVLSFDVVLTSSYCISLVKFSDKYKEWLEVFSNLLILNLSWTIRSESHIDFCTQSVIMTLGGDITKGALKFRKMIEFQSSWIAMNCQWIVYSYTKSA